MKTTLITAGAAVIALALSTNAHAQSRIVTMQLNGSSLKLTDDAGKVNTVTLKPGQSAAQATQEFVKAHPEYAPKPSAAQPAAVAGSSVQTVTTLVRDDSKPAAKQQTQEPKK